jgi:hypothetical protein
VLWLSEAKVSFQKLEQQDSCPLLRPWPLQAAQKTSDPAKYPKM